MLGKDTGLKDDYGTPIKEGDTVEFTYTQHGIHYVDEDGLERFIPGVSGGLMTTKEYKETKTIRYEIRGEIAGFFLDRPAGIGTTFISGTPKCKVIK